MGNSGSSNVLLAMANSVNSESCDSYFPLADTDRDRRLWVSLFTLHALNTLLFLLAFALGVVAISHPEISTFVFHNTFQGFAVATICFTLYSLAMKLLGLLVGTPWEYPVFVVCSILYVSIVGLACAIPKGVGLAIFEATILLSVSSVSVTLYALCAWIGDCNFGLEIPYLLAIISVLCVYVPIQIVHPVAGLWASMAGCVFAILYHCRSYCRRSGLISFIIECLISG